MGLTKIDKVGSIRTAPNPKFSLNSPVWIRKKQFVYQTTVTAMTWLGNDSGWLYQVNLADDAMFHSEYVLFETLTELCDAYNIK